MQGLQEQLRQLQSAITQSNEAATTAQNKQAKAEQEANAVAGVLASLHLAVETEKMLCELLFDLPP